jgi:membrane protein implicated in regulation of membrane protease activity
MSAPRPPVPANRNRRKYAEVSSAPTAAGFLSPASTHAGAIASMASSGAIQLLRTYDATVTGIPTDPPYGALPMMAIPPATGVVLVLIGLALFLLDLHVTNHGLPTAGAMVALLAGGLALFGAGVPYSGVLLGAVVVVSMLMGGVLFGILGSLRELRGRRAITGKEGMIGEVGTVRSPVGNKSEGWVFVHGERWRALLAYAPEGADPEDNELVVGVGHKVAVVGFSEGGVVEVVPVEPPSLRRGPDLTD